MVIFQVTTLNTLNTTNTLNTMESQEGGDRQCFARVGLYQVRHRYAS